MLELLKDLWDFMKERKNTGLHRLSLIHVATRRITAIQSRLSCCPFHLYIVLNVAYSFH